MYFCSGLGRKDRSGKGARVVLLLLTVEASRGDFGKGQAKELGQPPCSHGSRLRLIHTSMYTWRF